MDIATKQYKNWVLSNAKTIEWGFFFTANGNGLDLEWHSKKKYYHYNGQIKSITVDFYYEDETGSIKVAIECDDSSHEGAKKTDELRDASLKDQGIEVFRFNTKEISWNGLDCVNKVKNYIEKEKNRLRSLSHDRKFSDMQIKVESTSYTKVLPSH